MKTNLVAHMLVLSALIFASCEKNDDSLSDKFRSIELEKNEIIAKSDNSSFTIKAEDTGWGISQITEIENGKTTVKTNTFYIKETENSKVNTYHETMSGEWYKVSKSSATEITVEISKNTTGNDRKLVIGITGVGLQSANLTIEQKK